MSFVLANGPDDPRRCQGNESTQQCRYTAVNGTKYCPRHGGNFVHPSVAKEKTRNYNLVKFRARVNEFADNPEVKSLREEIGIMRMMIEDLVNMCKDSTDLLLNNQRISTLIKQVTDLVQVCHKLELQSGLLLDKSTILHLCDGIVRIIGDEVKDIDKLDAISMKILELTAKMGTLEDKVNPVVSN